MKKFLSLAIVVFFLISAGPVLAQVQQSSAAQAKQWVERADKYVQEVGLKAAIAEFNNPKGKFFKGDLYISAFQFDGKVIAFPQDPSKIGLNRINYKDVDGKLFIREFTEVAKTKGAGWVDFKYLNRKTNQVGQKTGYVKKVAKDVYLVCSADK